MQVVETSIEHKERASVHYQQFSMPQFLVEDEWKAVGGFEAILRYASRLADACKNEEKSNGVHVPAMRESLNGSLPGQPCV